METMKQQIGAWQDIYPDAAPIVNNTANGVDVYKITCKSTY
jgi:hypothetical protein